MVVLKGEDVIGGLLPKSWSGFSESIIEKFGVLFNPEKGDCSHEKACQWTADRGKVRTGRCAYWPGKGYPGSLEGQMEVDFDVKVIVFSPGDGIFIPAGQEHEHKGRVLTDKVKVILVEDGM
jgi:hypothetical protein